MRAKIIIFTVWGKAVEWRNMKKRNIMAGLGIVVSAAAACDVALSHYLLKYTTSRNSASNNRKVKKKAEKTDGEEEYYIKDASARATHDLERAMGKAWFDTVPNSYIMITSHDGLMLNAVLFSKEPSSSLYVILVHGYKADASAMYHYAYHYWQKGYNVLLPDLRGCGSSEGDYIGMGWLDRKDILSWIDYILSLNSDAKIVLHGESMGAAAVMMASGEETLPPNVKVIIEDSGYTSVNDILGSELDARFGLPKFPILNTASMLSQRKADYSFREASALKQVAKSHTPTLFIHGTGDDFVPCSMQEPLFEACSAPKDKYTVAGAEHCCSAFYDTDEYYRRVFDFIGKYI